MRRIFCIHWFLLIAISWLLIHVEATLASTATYRVTFDATWSSTTHPGSYPSDAHFSCLVGTTHNSNVSFWELGGIATNGIERMAETGGTSRLSSEIRAAGDNAHTMLSLSDIDSPGSISRTFSTPSSHSLVTLVTMIAPSPDWFVGVSGLDLHDGSDWNQQIVVDLYAYDSGTDSGIDFKSPDDDITPHIPIALLGAPFAGTPALGTYTFTLLDVQIPEPSTLVLAVITSLLFCPGRRRIFMQ